MSVLIHTVKTFNLLSSHNVTMRNQRSCLSTITSTVFGVPSEVLSLAATPSLSSSLSEQQLKVAIKSSSILLEDVRSIMGLSSINKTIGSYGNAAVGKVVAVPSSGSEFYLNDSVLVIGQGLWTDEVIVSASGAVKVTSLQPDEAALLPSFISAWAILHNYVALKAGDTVVQTTGNSAIGKAITAIGKALNLKVISLSNSELNDPEISRKLEELGSISLTVTGQSGKLISLLSKVTASNGVVVTYNGVYESFVTTTAVSVAISHLIFRNVSIQGFELLPWVQSSPSEYKAAAHSVLSLLSEKKIVLKPSLVYPQSDYLSGIEAVFKTGDTAVLKH